jgi:nucleoid-associated protein YgaU
VARDARRLTLPPLPDLDEIVPPTPAYMDEPDAGDDEATQPVDLYASLHAPERADQLDLTGILPTIALDPTPISPAALAAPARARARAPRGTTPGVRGRVAALSVRLVDAGKQRPVVRIPGASRTGANARRRIAGAFTLPERATLPPVWLLANLVILLVAGLAVGLQRVATSDAAAGCRWYAVRPGDTLGNIGWANHTTALRLAAANSIKNPDLIYVGQRLCIPVQTGARAASAPAVPTHSTPPRLGTPSGVQQFIAYVLPYAQRAHQQTGWPTSLILAQWGVEQGWHLPTYTGYNFGNCGAIPGEPTIGGLNVPGSPARFSYAATPEDGLRQYVHVAHLSYYAAVAPTAASSGVDAAARALGRSPWDAGHYTSSGNPGSSLLAVLHTYNLYQYDK